MKVLVTLALFMNALLPISFLALGIAQRSGGDEGLWAVLIFYPLVIGAPFVSIVTILCQTWRRHPQG